MIKWIGQSLPGIPILETNVYATPTTSANDLTHTERNTSVFDYLLREIRPKVILAHGQETSRVVAEAIQRAELRCSVLNTAHLRFWGKERAQKLAAEIQTELERSLQ